MAAQFIGLHMRVVLREPPGQQVTGTVREVEAGLGLTLTNVFIVSTKEWRPSMRIGALNIADLSEIKDDAPPPSNYAAPPAESIPAPAPAPAYAQPPLQPPQPPPHPPAFVDPAILSLGKRPKSISSGNQSASDRNVAGPDPKVSRPGNLFGGQALRQPEKEVEEDDEEDEEEEDEVRTVIAESLKNVTIEDRGVKNGNGGAETGREPRVMRKKPRTRVAKTQRGERRVPNITTTQTAETGLSGHGKGWRQTPILQSTAAFQPFNSLKRMSKKGKSSLDNGWASEDVTEEMGEFDFANNLAKFDKRTIFDQMRKEDQVDESSRLVSHNRRAKPGTAGGKNLHYTENVLDLPSGAGGADFWNSEADVNVNGAEKLSGRESVARRGGDSKPAASRRSQPAKTGTAAGSQPLSRVNSSVRYQASQRSSPGVGHRSTDYEQQQGRQESGLYLYPSMRRLETISSLQMLNVENIAANEVGFSEILMAENAGRGIAEVAVTALSDPAIKVRFQMVGSGSGSGPAGGDATLNSSTIVILAGNNKSSIRALAAGRHLRNRNFNVVVCLVGIERERDLLEDLRRQIQLYRNFGGKVLNKNDFFEWLRRNSESASGLSTSLIIDALLGLTMSFEELRIGDQASVYELMEWANRNEAFVLAVDVPSGIDPTSGKIAIIDGGHLFIKPRYVVAIGAPKRGLLEAVAPPSPGEDQASSPTGTHEDEWRLFIADLGLGSAVWRKSGTRIRKGIEFEGKWVLEMRYRGSDKDSESE
ncbi:Enhancer of mRNA-decapping protein 3 [Escovopsis weberi]|uniref:Enhancer of mRNA-decapping protein 3 n=1 Tax=Escovopsis weberi TaxID=150374 RepID=A0A0M8MTK5_ESCWE|nr:Enhancer of mRNA-decapping protein 3 [Escovopsis weberi]